MKGTKQNGYTKKLEISRRTDVVKNLHKESEACKEFKKRIESQGCKSHRETLSVKKLMKSRGIQQKRRNRSMLNSRQP